MVAGGWQVYAVDISSALVDKARRNCQGAQYSNVQFDVGALASLDGLRVRQTEKVVLLKRNPNGLSTYHDA